MRFAVIDTNVLVSAQMTQHEDSATRQVVKFIFDGYVTPIVTHAILAEYEEVLSRPRFHMRTLFFRRPNSSRSLRRRCSLSVIAQHPHGHASHVARTICRNIKANSRVYRVPQPEIGDGHTELVEPCCKVPR